jgi:hypothetical protein
MGNPHARAVAQRKAAFLQAVSPEDVEAVAHKLVAQALEGDVASAQLVLRYAIGRPPEAVDIDRLDQDELQILTSGPTIEDLTKHLGRIAIGYVCELVRGGLIKDEDQFVKRLAKVKAETEQRLELLDIGFSPRYVDRVIAGLDE